MKFNFSNSALWSTWALTFLIIAGDLIKPIKEILKATFTHHWIGKAVITTLVFIAIGFIFSKQDERPNKAWGNIVIQLILILIFYTIEYII